MDEQDLLATDAVWPLHHHAPVKAAGAEQCRVQDVRPVGRGEHDDRLPGIEPVHVGQDLVEGLFLFLVGASEPDPATTATDRVQLINEDDRGRILLGVGKEVSDAGSTHADDHLHELRSREGEERHTGLAGDRLGEQGLPGARRPYQKDTLGNASAQALVLLGVLQEVDNLLEFGLGLVDASDIGEGDPGRGLVRLVIASCTAASDAEDAPLRLLRPGTHPHQQSEEEQGRPETEQYLDPHRTPGLERLCRDQDIVGIQELAELLAHEARYPCLEGIRGLGPGSLRIGDHGLEVALDHLALRGDLADVALGHLVEEHRIRNLDAVRLRFRHDIWRDQPVDHQEDDKHDDPWATQ